MPETAGDKTDNRIQSRYECLQKKRKTRLITMRSNNKFSCNTIVIPDLVRSGVPSAYAIIQPGPMLAN